MRTKNFIFSVLALLFCSSVAFAQVSGVVVDDLGPVAGAVITVEQTGATTEADDKGAFSIDAKIGDELNVINPTTLAEKKVKVFKTNLGTVTISDASVVLEEVVTLGYGIKEDHSKSTTAYSVVSSEDIEKVTVTSFEQALQGQVAGFDVVSISGQPGGNTSMFLRGITSLTGNTDPLVVVDGVPVLTGDNAGLATTSNALATIDPSSIENVSLLKDAAATSLYGSRGANGVILVTLKKGKKGKSSLTFSSEFGFGDSAFDEMKMLDAQGHADYIATALLNAGFFNTFEDAYNYNLSGWDGTTNTDWKELTRNSNPITQRYALNYSGGSENLQLSSSLSYFSQEGLAIESKFDRVSGYLGTTFKASDKFDVGASVTLSRTEQKGPSDSSAFSNPIFTGLILSPTNPLYNDLGGYNLDLYYLNSEFNPVAIANTNVINSKMYKMLTSFNANYKILPELVFSTQAGVDFNYYDEIQWWNPDFGDGVNEGDSNGNGNGYKSDNNFLNWNLSNSLNYSKIFADVHEVSATAAIEALKTERQFTSSSGQGYVSGFDLIDLANSANPTDAYSLRTATSFFSYIGRLAYTYDSKYSLSYSIRRDGSSRFGSGNQYGTFMGGALAWNLDEENFIKDIDFINKVKLRASYGEVGNANIGNYAWRALYGPSAGGYEGVNAGYITNPGNSELQWETAKTVDVGIDFGFLQNRISGTVDWYQKKASNLLLDAEINPSTSGFTQITSNVGESQSSGIETLLKLDLFRDSEFKWDVTMTYAYNKNEVLDLNGNEEVSINGYKRLTVGHDPSEFRTRLWAGVDSSNGNPLWYTDETRTTTTSDINEASSMMTGEKALPTHIAGISSRMSYKNFSFNLQFSYKGDYSVYDIWGFVYNSAGKYGNLNQLAESYTDAWTPDNTDAIYPKVVWGDPTSASAASTRYLYDADHIRLRSAELGYTFRDNTLTKNTGVKSIYIYARGTNLWTYVFDDNLYFDPEMASNRAQYETPLQGLGLFDMTAPQMKQYLFGVKVNF